MMPFISTICGLLGAIIGTVATLTMQDWRSLNSRKIIAAKISTELESIINHCVANIKALKFLSENQEPINILHLKQLVYSDGDFYANTISDIMSVAPGIAVELLKFRLMMRNTTLQIETAIERVSEGGKFNSSDEMFDLTRRMEASAQKANALKQALIEYTTNPRHEFDLRMIWVDWAITQEIRDRILTETNSPNK